MDALVTSFERKWETSPSVGNGELVSPEYYEYLRLEGIFVGERLKKLIWKVDLRVLPQLILIYLLAYIDRSNAGNVKLFGALEDMHLSGQDWNTALSVFFATYALGGVPSNIALKRVGPNLWLPVLLTLCGILNIGHGLQSSLAGFTSLRLILGLIEAGIYPGCSYTLTNWYSPTELHNRMTIFYSGASLAGAFSGLLAYAIGHLDGTWEYRGWRFIYIIEGLLSVAVGLAAFWFLVPNPGKVTGWLSDDEKQFLLLRKKFSHGGQSGVHQEEAFSWKFAKQAFRSMHVYSVAAIEFTAAGVVYGISYVLPTIIADLGYGSLNAQVLTAPPYVFACLVVLYSGWMADRYKQRALAVVLPNVMAAVGIVIIIVSIRLPGIPGVTYFGIFFLAAGLYCVSPSVTAWISLNCAGDMKRAVSIGLMISIAQLSGILGSNIFLAREAPLYPTGFGICITLLVSFGIIWPGIYWGILKKINAQRAAMSRVDIAARYTEEELADMGDLSPLFRYST
ncbi:major facilitator superfamily domain-containing protein [Astrocystis sublimbata]|nr:major facilitator superfamily domain-containing protein [Astrocystis sublimbata]KAI0188260.1 major facilitator superfamily domain-containing protein [Astrocystis sublimbata]